MRIMTNSGEIEYSIVVPVFNSASCLEELVCRIGKVFAGLSKAYEVIMVDDASKDGSWQVMKSLRDGDNHLKIIRLMRNFGQHNAILCGFHHVSGKYVITMDDDLQNPPEEIPKLIQEIEKGYDLVIGARNNKHRNILRRMGTFCVGRITTKIFACPKDFQFSSFRIMSRHLMESVKKQKTPYPYITGMLLSVTDNVGNISVRHDKRKHGESNYSLIKLAKHGLNLLIYYSSMPLNLLTLSGFVVSLMSFSLAIFYMAHKMVSGSKVPGWTTVIVLLSFLGALLLLCLSLIGQYLRRIVGEVSRRRQFVVREKLL